MFFREWIIKRQVDRRTGQEASGGGVQARRDDGLEGDGYGTGQQLRLRGF